jgi:hypothetical protein
MCGCGGNRARVRVPTHQAPAVVVARVEKSKITLSELKHWSALVALRGSAMRERVLRFLIRAAWTINEARNLGIRVSGSEVRRRVAGLIKEQSEGISAERHPRERLLGRLLLNSRLHTADREWLMHLALLGERVDNVSLEDARHDVASARVARYYSTHRRQFFLPEQRQVEILGGMEGYVRQAKREVEAGKPFAEVAEKSLLPQPSRDGLWRLIRGRMEPQVEGPIFAAKPHVLIEPKHYSQYYMFDVLEVIPAHEQTLHEVEGRIREELASPARRLAREFRRRWIARTTCAAAYFVRVCRG